MGIVKNPLFKPIYKTKKRYILLTGGRGGAKSFEMTTFLCLLLYELLEVILFVRYTMISARKSIIPGFQDKIQRLEAEESFYVTDSEVTCLESDSKIMFSGVKTSSGIQTANLKSLEGITCLAVDEAEEFIDEEAFDTIDLSIRTTNKQNRVIISLNPSTKDHWIYKRWIANTHKIVKVDGFPVEISTHPDVLHIHTTYLDNLKHINESFINIVNRLKKESKKKYGHRIIGQWLDIPEGTLFPRNELSYFRLNDIPEDKFESSLAYIDVADEGNDYLCLVIGRNIGLKVYIVDVVYTDLGTKDSLAMCLLALKKHNVTHCRVESNNMGNMYADQLEEKAHDGCEIWTAASTTNKHTRIVLDSPFVNDFFVFLHEEDRSEMYELYVSHFTQYTKALNKDIPDDAPDANQGLGKWVKHFIDYD